MITVDFELQGGDCYPHSTRLAFQSNLLLQSQKRNKQGWRIIHQHCNCSTWTIVFQTPFVFASGAKDGVFVEAVKLSKVRIIIFALQLKVIIIMPFSHGWGYVLSDHYTLCPRPMRIIRIRLFQVPVGWTMSITVFLNSPDFRVIQARLVFTRSVGSKIRNLLRFGNPISEPAQIQSSDQWWVIRKSVLLKITLFWTTLRCGHSAWPIYPELEKGRSIKPFTTSVRSS